MSKLAPNLSRMTTVLAKVETTYGTSSSPAAASDAMLIFGDGASVYTPNISLIDYQALTGSVTRQPMKSGAKTASVTLNTCLMVSHPGGGSAGLTTFFDPLLAGCGLVSSDDSSPVTTRTWKPNTTVDVTPNETPDIDVDLDSVCFEVYADQILHKVNGAMGSFSLTANAGDIPRLNFQFQGKYVSPQYSEMPTGVVYPSDKKSLVGFDGGLTIKRNSATDAYGVALTNTVTTAQKPVIRSFSLNSGNSVVAKSDINADDGFVGFHIPDRRPTINVTYEVEKDLTPFSPINDLEDSITHELVFTHKTPVASAVATVSENVITAPQAQLTNVSYSDDGGIRMYNCSYALTHDGDSGASVDREYSIATKFTAA